MKGIIYTFIKMLTLSIKKTSVLGRKKYGETMYCKPLNGSILGNRKYSGDKIDEVEVSSHVQNVEKTTKED